MESKFKSSKLTKEQQAMINGLIEEHCETFSLHYDLGTHMQEEVNFKLCDEASFFVHQNAIEDEQNWLFEKSRITLKILYFIIGCTILYGSYTVSMFVTTVRTYMPVWMSP